MSKLVASPSNPAVRAARRLHRRAGRDDLGSFLVEGPIAVTEALEAGAGVQELFIATSEEAGFRAIARLAEQRGVRVTGVSDSVIKAISDSVTPQGVAATVSIPDASVPDAVKEADLVLVVAGVSDPGNAGTLIRTAEAAGAGAVVFTKGSVDPYAPKTVRSSAASLFRVPIVRGTEAVAAAADLKAAGFVLVGTDAAATTPVERADLTRRVAFVVGSEAHGVPAELASVVDETVRIEMPGPTESLNVAAAGAIVLFESVRQRNAAAGGLS